MKTEQILDALCNACTTLLDNIRVYQHVITDCRDDSTPDELADYFHDVVDANAHLFLSIPCSTVQTLYSALKDEIKTSEADEAYKLLYVHKYDGKTYGELLPLARVFHSMSHDAYNELLSLRNKYDL